MSGASLPTSWPRAGSGRPRVTRMYMATSLHELRP
jgi:hypothetical protein